MSTPTPTTALARRWVLEVNMGSTVAPDWQLCFALTDFKFEAPPNHEDDGTYDDGGWGDYTKTAQEWTATAKFNRKATADSTAFHPVHEKLRLAWLAYGADSEVEIRWYDREGRPEAYQGIALVSWKPEGGDRKSLEQVECEFKGKRELNPITNPAA